MNHGGTCPWTGDIGEYEEHSRKCLNGVNAEMGQLRKDVKDLKDQVKTLQGKLNSIHGEYDTKLRTKEDEIVKLNTQLEKAKSDLENMKMGMEVVKSAMLAQSRSHIVEGGGSSSNSSSSGSSSSSKIPLYTRRTSKISSKANSFQDSNSSTQNNDTTNDSTSVLDTTSPKVCVQNAGVSELNGVYFAEGTPSDLNLNKYVKQGTYQGKSCQYVIFRDENKWYISKMKVGSNMPASKKEAFYVASVHQYWSGMPISLKWTMATLRGIHPPPDTVRVQNEALHTFFSVAPTIRR